MTNILKESQEDAYYHSKNEAEQILGIKISSDQWNAYFFKVIDPMHSTAVTLTCKLLDIQRSLKVIDKFKEESL